MNYKYRESASIIITAVALMVIPPTINRYSPEKADDGMRTIHLTGVKRGGVWTEEKVTALNHGWKEFQAVTIRLAVGEKIRLVLSSSDVTHSFYVPELNPEQIIVNPGHVEELILVGREEGVYTYYCTKVCGDCHYLMRGSIIVGAMDLEAVRITDTDPLVCDLNHSKPKDDISFLGLGEYLYKSSGCASCHGEHGQGGIQNYNYVNREIPALDVMAERLKIWWEEDAEIAVQLLQIGKMVDLPRGEDPIEGYGRFLAQYHSVVAKINDGSPKVQKLDPSGPEPPLEMPSWQTKLSSREVDAIIAYLISEFDWTQFD